MSITYFKLRDLPIEWKRGAGLKKSDVTDAGDKLCILYGELFTKHKKVLVDKLQLSRTNKTGNVISKQGDVLVPATSTASRKEMILAREVDTDGIIIGGDINIIRTKEGIFASRYLPYFFGTLDAYRQLEKYITGSTGIIHISNSGIKNLEIPVPSIKKQEQIIAKIEELFSEIDKSIRNLQNELTRCTLLRASIIQHAYNKITSTTTELNSVTEVITDGDHQAPPKSTSGIPFIVISNIVNNKVILKRATRCVPESYYSNLKDSRKAKTGDIIYTVTGSYGIPALIETDDKFCFQRHIALLRPDKSKVSSKYLFYALQTDSVYKQATNIATGTAQLTVPLTGLRKITIPVVDLDEQDVIVDTVEAQLSELDALHSILNTTIIQAKNMKQSILSKAFKGDLV